jgi:hypothetical protein
MSGRGQWQPALRHLEPRLTPDTAALADSCEGVCILDYTHTGTDAIVASTAIAAGTHSVSAVCWVACAVPRHRIDPYAAPLRTFYEYWMASDTFMPGWAVQTQWHGRSIGAQQR